MLSLRASLAFALFAALAASPAYATIAASKPTPHTAQRHSASRPHATTAHHAAASRAATHPAATAHSTHPASAATHSANGAHKKAAARSRRPRGQLAIEPGRVTEIQQALIRVHYLHGEANGQWNETTRAAMQKYQADQGWQTKLMPDSRALKKLGLGPDYSNAINAKNSSFAVPPATDTIPPVQSEGFAEAAGVSR